ncbi:substrate-specific activator of APC-dependent proteolysis [Physocladia obscura]|uniref:Substrate-specific activator of APC-dependent proteolysis n=1 Tax=Physocladia obscura TaxID=109957 RepID=A0AAD5XFF3_9FUNG|nr:substrate-specific activator of APC-dependent proteolysis [Physocladia obscura]
MANKRGQRVGLAVAATSVEQPADTNDIEAAWREEQTDREMAAMAEAEAQEREEAESSLNTTSTDGFSCTDTSANNNCAGVVDSSSNGFACSPAPTTATITTSSTTATAAATRTLTPPPLIDPVFERMMWLRRSPHRFAGMSATPTKSRCAHPQSSPTPTPRSKRKSMISVSSTSSSSNIKTNDFSNVIDETPTKKIMTSAFRSVSLQSPFSDQNNNDSDNDCALPSSPTPSSLKKPVGGLSRENLFTRRAPITSDRLVNPPPQRDDSNSNTCNAQQEHQNMIYQVALASEVLGAAAGPVIAAQLAPFKDSSDPNTTLSTLASANTRIMAFKNSPRDGYYPPTATAHLMSETRVPTVSVSADRNVRRTPVKQPGSASTFLRFAGTGTGSGGSSSALNVGGSAGRAQQQYGSLMPRANNFQPSVQTQQIVGELAKQQPRVIFKSPYKVLDAPELQDDFYLNLVDWSTANILGVGLGSCVYLWNAQSSVVTKLCDLSAAARNGASSVAGNSGNATGDVVTSVNWNPKGNLVAIGTNKGAVEVWDIEAKKKLHELIGHTSRVGSIAWCGNLLTTGSRDRSILMRDIRLAPRESEMKLTSHKQEVCGLKWDNEDNRLASGGNDNRLLIWDLKKIEKPVLTYSEHTAAVKAIAWSPHKSGLLASGGGTADQYIRFWNVSSSSSESLSQKMTHSQVCNLAWSSSDDEIVSTHGFSQNQVIVWTVGGTRYNQKPTLSSLETLTGHTMRVLYLAISPDNQNIVTGAGS